MELKVGKVSIKTKDGWRELSEDDATLSHADLCQLSRKFNMVGNLRMEQDQRINQWLQSKIAQAYAFEQAQNKGK